MAGRPEHCSPRLTACRLEHLNAGCNNGGWGMADETESGQRAFMRNLVKSLGFDQYQVCAAYAEAERDGQVRRKRNVNGKTPEEYALALWRDAEKKGWL